MSSHTFWETGRKKLRFIVPQWHIRKVGGRSEDVLPPLPHYSGSVTEISDKTEHSLSECHFGFGSGNPRVWCCGCWASLALPTGSHPCLEDESSCQFTHWSVFASFSPGLRTKFILTVLGAMRNSPHKSTIVSQTGHFTDLAFKSPMIHLTLVWSVKSVAAFYISNGPFFFFFIKKAQSHWIILLCPSLQKEVLCTREAF